MTMTANGLAKLLEESSELGQVAAKRLAYFTTTVHPDGAGDLNERMEAEMGDLSAACSLVQETFSLNVAAIRRRAGMKLELFRQWQADPNNGAESFHAARDAERAVELASKGGAGVSNSAVTPQQADWEATVEQRIRSWKQRVMNRSGDRLAIDDLMDQESLEDLIDCVCAPLPGKSMQASIDEKAAVEFYRLNPSAAVQDLKARLRRGEERQERVHALVNAGPTPGMSEAFDRHMGAACWTDPAYRGDASTWAAAWKAALREITSDGDGEQLNAATADLVRRFAGALREKLAAAERKYGYSDNWRDEGWMDECRAELARHVSKGDPRDVAAYCAFLWHHGESTAVRKGAGEVERHGLDTQTEVFFYEQDFYVLSNFSSFGIEWRGNWFATSEHAYHWEKFVDVTGAEDSAGLICHQVRDAASAHEAFKLAERHKQLRRSDWDAVKVKIMRDILRTKASQHEYVRRKLLETGERRLVENSWRDDFWGWGDKRDGQNMLGRLWTEIRAELRSNECRLTQV
jgi:ribA/ribD-fused uncharacterized protein